MTDLKRVSEQLLTAITTDSHGFFLNVYVVIFFFGNIHDHCHLICSNDGLGRGVRAAVNNNHYHGLASISRLLKMIGLFCRISSLL